MHDLDLRRRVVIEDSLVLWILQQVLERGAGSDAAEIFLDDGAGGNFAALGRGTSGLRHCLANKAGIVAGPTAGAGENPIEGDTGHTVGLGRRYVDDPEAESGVGGIVAGVDKGDVAGVRGPGGE